MSDNTKRCTKCQEEKLATSEFFHRDKSRKDGLCQRCKICIKIYHQANKERISKRGSQYYKANKEKIAAKQKQYRKANRKRVLEKKKQYREENRHLIQHWTGSRRAAKLKQTPDYTNLDLIKLIYKNCPHGYEVDHMIPISGGGLHHESNLCYLPKDVNQSKGAKTIKEFGEEKFNKNVIYWQDVL